MSATSGSPWGRSLVARSIARQCRALRDLFPKDVAIKPVRRWSSAVPSVLFCRSRVRIETTSAIEFGDAAHVARPRRP